MHVHQRSPELLTDDGGFTAEGRHYVAGQLAHAPALCALAAPTVNSYRRLHAGPEAPGAALWGHVSRAALVRVTANLGKEASLEFPRGRSVGQRLPTHRRAHRHGHGGHRRPARTGSAQRRVDRRLRCLRRHRSASCRSRAVSTRHSTRCRPTTYSSTRSTHCCSLAWSTAGGVESEQFRATVEHVGARPLRRRVTPNGVSQASPAWLMYWLRSK